MLRLVQAGRFRTLASTVAEAKAGLHSPLGALAAQIHFKSQGAELRGRPLGRPDWSSGLRHFRAPRWCGAERACLRARAGLRAGAALVPRVAVDEVARTHHERGGRAAAAPASAAAGSYG